MAKRQHEQQVSLFQKYKKELDQLRAIIISIRIRKELSLTAAIPGKHREEIHNDIITKSRHGATGSTTPSIRS